MRILRTILFALLLAPAALAQITFDGGSFQTEVSAGTPGCLDDGIDGVGVSPGTASCTTGGYSAVASATAGFSSQANGGEVTAAGEAEAATTGGPPLESSTAISTSTAGAAWILGAPAHYSLVIESAGGAFTNFSGMGVPFPAPPSGIVTGTNYSLNVSVNMTAAANDLSGAEIVVATPQTVTASVTFAPVGSPTLIMGTVLAGGSAMPNLLIEALDGPVVVATTQTANDGSYLLDGLPASVNIRSSDPSGAFVTETSSLLFPPATYNTDLAPITTIPALRGPFLLGLALMLALTAVRVSSRRAIVRQ